MAKTRMRSHRLRAFAAAAGVGLVVFIGANTPASAEPGGSEGNSTSDSSGSGQSGTPGDAPSDAPGSPRGNPGAGESSTTDTGDGDPDGGGSDGEGSGDENSGDGGSGGEDLGSDDGDTPSPERHGNGSDADEPSPPDSAPTSNGANGVAPTPPDPPAASDAAAEATTPDFNAEESPSNQTSGTEDLPARRPPEDIVSATERYETPGVGGQPEPSTHPPGKAPRAGGPEAAAIMADRIPDSSRRITPTLRANNSSPTVVALGPHPKRTGAIGVLAFLGVNMLGSGTTGAVSPGPWALLWWIRRFGSDVPTIASAPAFAPGRGLLLDIPTDIPTDPGPTSARDVLPPDPAPAFTTLPAGAITGSVTLRDVDGHSLPSTPEMPGPVDGTVYRSPLGGACTIDPISGAYTYAPCLRARVAAAADDAPESTRFDPFTIRADDHAGAAITVGIPVAGPYSAGRITVPGKQIDDAVVSPAGTWFVTTHDGDRTYLTVISPDATSATTILIPGEPSEGIHGVVLGPDGRAHQVTHSDEIVGDDVRTTMRITSVDESGVPHTTAPIPGRPHGGLRFGPDGTGYLLSVDENPTGTGTTHLITLGPGGTPTSTSVPGKDGHLLVSPTGDVQVAVAAASSTALYRVAAGGLTPLTELVAPDAWTLWDHRGDATYFAAYTGDAAEPHSTLTIRHADGEAVTHAGLPGRLTFVRPGHTSVHVLSESAGSAHITTVGPNGRWTTNFAAMTVAAAANGAGDTLFAAMSDPMTAETIVVATSPEGGVNPVMSTVGLVDIRTNRMGDVFVVSTTTTADGRDTTTVTVIRPDGRTASGRLLDGTPISLQFSRSGDAHLAMMTTDEATGDTLTSFAVVRPDAAVVRSPAVAGEPAGDPTIADDGTTFITLTRFAPSTRQPHSAVVAFDPDGRARMVGEFPGHATRGPRLSPTGDGLAVVTHGAGAATLRVVDAHSHRSGDPLGAKVFDVAPQILGVDPDTGAVTATIGDAGPDEGALGFLTTDPQVELDPTGGRFVFTPTPEQRSAADPDGRTSHSFTVLVSDPSGASAVLAVTVPVTRSSALPSLG